MAVVRWNFPNGSNGEVLTNALTGTNHNSLDGGTYELSTAQSYAALGSGKSAHFIKSATGAQYLGVSGLSATSFAFDVYVYMVAKTSGTYIIWSGASSSLRAIALQYNPSGNLTMIHGTGVTPVWTSTTVIPLNTWVRYSVYLTCDPTVGTARVQWYDLSVSDTTPVEDSGTVSSLNTQSVIDRVRFGGSAASTSQIGQELYFSSWAYDTAATGLMPPYSAGTPANWRLRNAGAWTPVSARERESGAWSARTTNIK